MEIQRFTPFERYTLPLLVYYTSGLLYTNILFTHQIYQYLSSFVPKEHLSPDLSSVFRCNVIDYRSVAIIGTSDSNKRRQYKTRNEIFKSNYEGFHFFDRCSERAIW